MGWLLEPWPWYVGGPLIGLMVPLLLLLAGKQFGISSSLEHVACAILPKNKQPAFYRNRDWRINSWNLILVLGVVVGAFIGNYWLSNTPAQFLPPEYYSLSGVVKLAIGGLLIGFGTRYASGCTSGHTIMGISKLQLSSLVATISFFIGGLLTTFVFARLLAAF